MLTGKIYTLMLNIAALIRRHFVLGENFVVGFLAFCSPKKVFDVMFSLILDLVKQFENHASPHKVFSFIFSFIFIYSSL